jgi:hypothetical protein
MSRPAINDAIVYHAACLFLDPNLRSVDEIADQLNKIVVDLKASGQLEGDAPVLNRPNVYRLIRQARARGFIQLVPPLDKSMPEELGKRFAHSKDSFTVVSTLGQSASEQVSAQAARVVLDLLKKVVTDVRKKENKIVSIGLGPGRGTLDVCRHLGPLLQVDSSDLRLRLVAISAGAPALQPEIASSSFFNLFPSGRVVDRVGFFAETLIACSEFKNIQERPGISEAFREKQTNNIDVVITSMGDLADREDLLGAFLEQARTSNLKINETLRSFLEKRASLIAKNQDTRRMKELIASVQYRPYNEMGPIDERKDKQELRACTLFELEDFVKMVERGQHVILIARQCGACGMTRARALRPLLTRPDLKVWSHIVMDLASAKDLLSEGP